MIPHHILNSAITLRKYLHAHPEVSGNEVNTASKIMEFLGKSDQRKIKQNLGGNGILVTYKSGNKGPEILIRADIDALPIQEINSSIPYISEKNGVAHLCGHDGHTAILAGLAKILDSEGITTGIVHLLFQPSEETGKGARRILNEEKLKNLKPDYVFALHNLPGYPMGQLVIRKGTFASSSCGIKIKYQGKTAHAAEPESGISPEPAISKVLQKVERLRASLDDDTLLTTTHISMGKKVFGISPAEASMWFTLRSGSSEKLDSLIKEFCDEAEEIGKLNHLSVECSKSEYFPATINNDLLVSWVNMAAENSGMKVSFKEKPFRWSEDFGWFTKKFDGVLFGLGSGIEQPALHNPDFNFPDELIENGILLFKEIIKVCQNPPLSH